LRNVLDKVRELRYDFGMLPPQEFNGFGCQHSTCLRCREIAGLYISEYVAFGRKLMHGKLPCYVDLLKLKRGDIKRLTLRHSPAPESYCRHCGVNH